VSQPTQLGDLEELVLLAVLRFGEEAHGGLVRDDLDGHRPPPGRGGAGSRLDPGAGRSSGGPGSGAADRV